MGADLVPIGDGLTLDLSRGCLVRGQEPLHLRPQSYEVLKFLAERPGQLVSKDTLVAHVWEGRAVGDGSLGKCVEEIREALGPAARERLRTVWGRGYILEPVAAPSAITAAALSGEPSGQPKPPPRDRKFTPRSYLPAAAALVLVLAFGVWRYTTARDEPLNAIAVLPFVNASGTPDLEYLSDGISEKLIDRLSRISGLRVIAWSSSLRYKDANADPLTVSSSLGVAAIVTGQVAVRGKTLQVTTELVDGRTRARLWGERYSRDLSDALAVENAISLEIAERLHVRLTGDERQRLATSRSVNPDAYVLVLKGRHFWNRRTLEDFEKAIAAFNDAIALEPGYAAAHAGLADAYLTRADYSAIVRRGDFALGKAAALKALELDETLAEAHTSLAHVLWADGDVAGAEREYTRAIALNPGYATAHHWYGNYLRAQGRPDEAMAELRRAVAIDPLSPIINTAIGGHYHSAGNYSEAIRQLRATVDLNPTFPNAREFLGTSYLQAGMHELAIVEFEKAVELSGRGDLHLGKLGHAYAVSGRTADAQRILAELLDLRSRSPVSATNIALVYVGLGDKDQAFAWLESARQDGDERLLIVRSPVFESLRSDQRFDRLVERAGLPR